MFPAASGSLSDVATGKDNHYFRSLAATLVNEGRGDTVIRLGWEFNTPFFRWGVKTPADARHFAEGWRQVVGSMRAASGQHFEFVWNPNLSDKGIDPALAYPGDPYVDDIGLDVYDRSLIAGESPAERWDSLVHQRFGLQWQATFAAQHNKPLAFPEWGLVHDPEIDTAGEDDPLFIKRMHEWFASHDTAFENYFDDPSAHGAAFDVDGKDFPEAARVYRHLFGSAPIPSTAAGGSRS